MAAPLVAELLGGTPFLGFIAAVAFATILAVVAGLTLAGASALSHDIFVHVVRKGHATEAEQVRVARMATVVFGAGGGAAGDCCSRARTSRSWSGWRSPSPAAPTSRRCCSRSCGGASTPPAPSARSSAGAIAVGAADPRQSDRLGRPAHNRDGHLSRCATRRSSRCPLAFLAGIVGSLLTREPAAEAKFDDEKLRTYLGVGAE